VQDVFTSRGGRAPFTKGALQWRADHSQISRVARAAYVDAADANELQKALAIASAANGVNTGRVAAALRKVDCPPVIGPAFLVPPTASGRRAGARRLAYPDTRVCSLGGIPVVDGLQMLVDLAADLDEILWEQSLESTLYRKLTTALAIEAALPELSRARTKGVRVMREVLALRPPGAPPTESLLETLMVQLARSIGAPLPTRQFRVYNEFGGFEGRVDLCWPELGLFCELDGEHHKGQPVYDANRETRVVAVTGWLCGRFSWTEVRYNPVPTGRRLLRVIEQARRRPLSRAVGMVG
jgi:very-short-patch-repair endonuclease